MAKNKSKAKTLRYYEVTTVERVKRTYSVEATNDMNAEEKVQLGEVTKFTEGDAEIEEMVETRRIY